MYSVYIKDPHNSLIRKTKCSTKTNVWMARNENMPNIIHH